MPNMLEVVNSIEAPRPYSESDVTRFDPNHNPSRFYVPEQPQPAEMFTHNPELEVAATVQKAAELAKPAGNTFIVPPQTPEQIAAEQEAYAAVPTEKSNNVENPEDRRYANPEAALNEAMNAGAAIEMIRNAA